MATKPFGAPSHFFYLLNNFLSVVLQATKNCNCVRSNSCANCRVAISPKRAFLWPCAHMNKCTYVQQKLGVCTFAELWQNLRNCVLFCRLPANCHSPYKKYLQGLENFSQFGIIQAVIVLLAIGNHSEVAHIKSVRLSVWHGNVPTLQMLCPKATRFVDITHKFFGFLLASSSLSIARAKYM